MSGLGLSGVADDLFDCLSQGQYRGRRDISTGATTDGTNDGRGPRSERLRPAVSRCREGDRLAQARNPYYAESAIARQQAAALVVEQPAPGDLRRPTVGLGCRTGRRPNGRRSRNRSPCSNMASRRRQGDQPAERVFRRRSRATARRPTGRSGDDRPAAATCRSATTRSPRSRCRRSMNIGTSTATTRRRRAGVVMLHWAFSCVWNWDARPFPIFPARWSAMGRRAATGRPATGSTGAGPALAARRRRRPPPAPGAYRELPDAVDARLVDACHGRASRPDSPTMSRAARARATSRASRYYDIELTYEVVARRRGLPGTADDRRLLR